MDLSRRAVHGRLWHERVQRPRRARHLAAVKRRTAANSGFYVGGGGHRECLRNGAVQRLRGVRVRRLRDGAVHGYGGPGQLLARKAAQTSTRRARRETDRLAGTYSGAAPPSARCVALAPCQNGRQTSCSFVVAGYYVDPRALGPAPCPPGKYSGSGAKACVEVPSRRTPGPPRRPARWPTPDTASASLRAFEVACEAGTHSAPAPSPAKRRRGPLREAAAQPPARSSAAGPTWRRRDRADECAAGDTGAGAEMRAPACR